MSLSHVTLLTALFFGCGCAHLEPANEVRPEVAWKSHERGLDYYFTVSVKLPNDHDFPVWFLIGRFANKELNRNGTFAMGTWSDAPFEANVYDDARGRSVLVDYFGDDGFQAVLVPARSHVTYEKYLVQGNDPIVFFDICQANSLRVNGKVPVETWLPYDVRSDREAIITGRLYSGTQKSLDYELELAGKRLPEERVRFVKAEVMTSFRFSAPPVTQPPAPTGILTNEQFRNASPDKND